MRLWILLFFYFFSFNLSYAENINDTEWDNLKSLFPFLVQSNTDEGQLSMAHNTFLYKKTGGNKGFLNFTKVKMDFWSDKDKTCRYTENGLLKTIECKSSNHKKISSKGITFPKEEVSIPHNYENNYHIKPSNNVKYNLEVKKNKAILLSDGIYFFKNLLLEEGGIINLVENSKVIIYIQGSGATTLQGYVNANGKSENLIIYTENSVSMNHNSCINGNIYSENNININGHSELSNGIYPPSIIGRVSAKNITLTKNANIVDKGKCQNETLQNDYTIEIKPKELTTCSREIDLDFIINKNGYIDTEFKGSISITTSDRDSIISSSKKGPPLLDTTNIKLNNGKITLYLQGKNDVEIKATINGVNNDSTAIGKYRFLHCNFEHIDVNYVAGDEEYRINNIKDKEKFIPIVFNSQSNDLKYDGLKKIKFDNLIYKSPVFVKIKPLISYQKDSNGTYSDYIPIDDNKINEMYFSNGKSRLRLKYMESGIFSFNVSDEINEALGVVTISSIPWALVICSDEYTLKNGNAEKLEHSFKKAGESFKFKIRALACNYKSSQCDKTNIDTTLNSNKETDYCTNIYKTTSNYFSKYKGVNFESFLSSPLLPNNMDNNITNKLKLPSELDECNIHDNFVYKCIDRDDNTLVYNIKYTDVGQIKLTVIPEHELSVVNSSSRKIGRFYPAYLDLDLNNTFVKTPDNQTFTYMEQPFSAGFRVNAFNQQNDKVKYYYLFNNELKSKIELFVNNKDQDLTSRYRSKLFNDWILANDINLDWLLIDGHSMINYQPDAVKFIRKTSNKSLNISKEDGPYFEWQLKLKQRTIPDGVTWKDNDNSMLIGVNDIRYGRMVLQDTAGGINKALTIPLQVEYWNGYKFVINTDDFVSKFDGANYCRQILIQKPNPNIPNNPETFGSGTVIAGQSSFITKPDGVFKQQIRFWQRISKYPESTPNKIYCAPNYSNTDQSWLSYNWRGLGDEGPSAIVTFGVYRGNARIIYRGEAGIRVQ